MTPEQKAIRVVSKLYNFQKAFAAYKAMVETFSQHPIVINEDAVGFEINRRLAQELLHLDEKYPDSLLIDQWELEREGSLDVNAFHIARYIAVLHLEGRLNMERARFFKRVAS